jgi:hypothetical protein
VLDEAMGKQVSPVPFRGATSTLLAPTPSRRGKVRARLGLLVALGLAGLLGVSALYLDAAAGPGLSLAAPGPATVYENAPPVGFEEASRPLGTPPDVGPLTEGQGFRFLRHEDNGDPVTWSPCRPIHYVMRPDNAPTGGDAMLLDAMARMSFATRLSFVNDGPTTEGPSEDRSAYQRERYGDRWAPVLIAWATRAEVPDFGIDIAGEAGPSSVRTPSGDTTYVSGVVYLDPVKIEEIRRGAGEAAAQVTLLHELGHLVGLAHVDVRRRSCSLAGTAKSWTIRPGTGPALLPWGGAPVSRTSEPFGAQTCFPALA